MPNFTNGMRGNKTSPLNSYFELFANDSSNPKAPFYINVNDTGTATLYWERWRYHRNIGTAFTTKKGYESIGARKLGWYPTVNYSGIYHVTYTSSSTTVQGVDYRIYLMPPGSEKTAGGTDASFAFVSPTELTDSSAPLGVQDGPSIGLVAINQIGTTGGGIPNISSVSYVGPIYKGFSIVCGSGFAITGLANTLCSLRVVPLQIWD
jgi:hypothetical protein